MISYMRKNPLENLPRLFDLALKAPIAPQHREQVKSIKEGYENNPVIQQYVTRILKEVDPSVQEGLLVNFFINAVLIGIPRQRKLSEELGVNVPFTILIDPTSNCNLRCRGCWAGAYEKHQSLSLEEMDRIVTEAKSLGIHFIVFSGGEPLLWPHLLDLCQKHKDVAFMLYTNGTLIDKAMAAGMRQAANMSPVISIEGPREYTDERRGQGVFDKIMQAMDNLRREGVAFGFSLTVTRKNCHVVFSDDFIDLMIAKGALYGWSFHYIPIGSDPDFSLVLTPEQRSYLVERVREIRATKPIQVADFWNDGHLTGGCIAGGRRYFHITASGAVEPCAFVHFSLENIQGKSLKEVLGSKIFKAYQARQPLSENLLRPCPLIDVPQALREIVAESGARPTHEGADSILKGEHKEALDQIAAAWQKEADRLEKVNANY
ncbi:MAG: radical SAM protein [Firmicutes bacterium]|nr:radical SAM protein [Bacillota bacterium]